MTDQLTKCLESCHCYVCRAHRRLMPKHAIEFVERMVRDIRRADREAEYQARQRPGWFERLFVRQS